MSDIIVYTLNYARLHQSAYDAFLRKLAKGGMTAENFEADGDARNQEEARQYTDKVDVIIAIWDPSYIGLEALNEQLAHRLPARLLDDERVVVVLPYSGLDKEESSHLWNLPHIYSPIRILSRVIRNCHRN